MSRPDLDAWVARSLEAAAAAFPTLRLDGEATARWLVTKAEALAGEDAQGIDKLRATDLVLAFACLEGRPEAMKIFEEAYVSKVERVLGRSKIATVDDLKSQLREQLYFGADGSRPLLESYSGRGDVGSWLRSIAIRMAQRAKKRDERHVEADLGLASFATEANPEIDYLRRMHTVVFEESLKEAIEGLATRDRNLLRQHYLDGLNVDALGQLYGVHRATAARWVADVRDRVLDAVKSRLAARMSPSELESFLRATRDELGLRLSKLLRVTATT